MKNINQILSENFSAEEIKEIKNESAARADEYMKLKHSVSDEIKNYLGSHKMTINEIKAKLETSTSQTQRIVSGDSNFTLETLIKVGSLIGKRPKIIFE